MTLDACNGASETPTSQGTGDQLRPQIVHDFIHQICSDVWILCGQGGRERRDLHVIYSEAHQLKS